MTIEARRDARAPSVGALCRCQIERAADFRIPAQFPDPAVQQIMEQARPRKDICNQLHLQSGVCPSWTLSTQEIWQYESRNDIKHKGVQQRERSVIMNPSIDEARQTKSFF